MSTGRPLRPLTFAAEQAVEKTSTTPESAAEKFAAEQAVEKSITRPMSMDSTFAAEQAVEK